MEGISKVTSYTLDYYNANAESFAASTVAVDFSVMQNRFADLLPNGADVLDFGCGSGRDAKRFLEMGFDVVATDGSFELCRVASEFTGLDVRYELFEELSDVEAYDGIWACSSILHVPKDKLPGIFTKMARALKPNGVIYTSFKYGDFEGERNGRYFSDFTEKTFALMLKSLRSLCIEDVWITGDVRPGRGDERWLNLVLRKK